MYRKALPIVIIILVLVLMFSACAPALTPVSEEPTFLWQISIATAHGQIVVLTFQSKVNRLTVQHDAALKQYCLAFTNVEQLIKDLESKNYFYPEDVHCVARQILSVQKKRRK